MADDGSARRWASENAVLLAVLAATALALLARLVALGWRVFHWDEARVGYWVLRFQETGVYEYRAIVHGPFIPQVNRLLFELLGTSDFVARLPVAVVGGLLPLAAWLLHERLRDEEVVAMALLLAVNPLLVYFSRFMRNDVLVAAFSVFAFAFVVRALDTGERRYLLAGIGALALAFTTKENVLIYVGIWVGAAGLLYDHRLFLARARDGPGDWLTVAWAELVGVRRGVARWRWALAAGLVEFLAIVVFFYAPRPEFGMAFADPTMVPGVLGAATVGAWQSFWSTWVGGGLQGHEYMPFFTHYVDTLRVGALPLVVLAVGGFLYDRYTGGMPRDVVAFAAYWGFVSVLIYPLVSDIQAAWTGVHTVAPLAVPAAVGLGLVFRWGRSALASEDRVGVALAALLVLAVGGQIGYATTTTSFVAPQERGQFQQYGQPQGQMKPTLADVGRIAAVNDGPDVLFYGEHFYVENESGASQPPATGNWYQRLPLPWYLEKHDVTPSSTQTLSDLGGDVPPVVMTRETHQAEVGPRLEGYESRTYLLTQDIPGNQVYLVVYIDREALQRANEADAP